MYINTYEQACAFESFCVLCAQARGLSVSATREEMKRYLEAWGYPAGTGNWANGSFQKSGASI